MTTDKADEMTLADHAEAWWSKQGNIVPARETSEWTTMYEKWVEFAFADFSDPYEDTVV